MTDAAHPNPAHLPTLTEVIELLPPTPVGDDGMHRAPRQAPPEPGTPGSAPIVTGGLASSKAPANWTPFTTVVVPTLREEVALPLTEVPPADLPVLDAVVPEIDDLSALPAMAPLPDEAPPADAPQTVPQPDVVNALAQEPVVPSRPEVQPLPSAPALPDITEAQLALRVLNVVQKQIDGMIDFRLKEAMAPILARHSEALVRDLREELSKTMSDVVARAVAQEMSKLRQR